MRRLESIHIKNFKSIREQSLALGSLNVFIGGNGVGKSNFVGVFRMLHEVRHERLQAFVAARGGADAILHMGRKRSSTTQIKLDFVEYDIGNAYRLILAPDDEDGLFVKSEDVFYHQRSIYPEPTIQRLLSGKAEASIARSRNKVATYVRGDLDSYRVYHFHDTSDSSPAKLTADVNDNRYLRPQAENLPAYLYFLKERHADHFALIEDTIRQIAPFVDRFQLEPSMLNPEKIRFEWLERASDAYFNASSLSDGTLRFICLATLLLQPRLPNLILIDEPELGLHPAAIQLLAALLKSAARRTQVIVATQSVTLVNQLTPEDVWVCDRVDGATVFRHLRDEPLDTWLENYSLGELWEKNSFGGRP
jgi:predicted ATPase